MVKFNTSDIQRVAVSAMGALTLSAACVFGAVAPAKAEAPATVAAWQAQVEHRIADAPVVDSERFAPSSLHSAEVALHFTAGGDFAGASLARSSGNRVLDSRAVKLAGALVYPQLPADVRGAAQDVTMRLYFGDAASGAAIPIEHKRARMAELVRARATQVAAR